MAVLLGETAHAVVNIGEVAGIAQNYATEKLKESSTEDYIPCNNGKGGCLQEFQTPLLRCHIFDDMETDN
jgi:hypothetical protein